MTSDTQDEKENVSTPPETGRSQRSGGVKRFAYVAVFTIAGEFAGGFLALLIGLLLMNLWAAGMINYPFHQCMGAVSLIAFILMTVGGLLGFAGGKHFWPVLYDDDGNLRFKGVGGFKKRMREHRKEAHRRGRKTPANTPNGATNTANGPDSSDS